MIFLNVIPEELKKEIKLNDYYAFYKKIGAAILLMLLFFAGALNSAKIILSQQSASTGEEAATASKNNEDHFKQITEINIQLSEIKNIQKDNLSWTNFLLGFAGLCGDGIKISQLNADQKENTIRLSGTAALRSDLLGLKESLEKSGNFSDIKLPISSLLEKENINFEINANISRYEF